MALLHIDFLSHELRRTVPMVVVYPSDTVRAGASCPRNYKTLYLLHGVYGDCLDWVSNTPIRRWAEEKGVAVVMPSGDNAFYLDDSSRLARYGAFVGTELVEQTRAMLHLSHRREDTFIGGLSMGGYGALRIGLLNAETFGSIVAFSSVDAVDLAASARPVNDRFPFMARPFLESLFGDLDAVPGSDADVRALARRVAGRGSLPRIYLSCGDGDTLMDANRELEGYLRDLGFDVRYEQGEGSHEWGFWTRALARALDWLPLDASERDFGSGNVGL